MVSLSRAQELLGAETEAVETEVERLEAEMSGIKEEMDGLKGFLYARFGRGINLEG